MSTGVSIALLIILLCGICLYAALLLVEKLRTMFLVNYLILVLVVVLLFVGVGYLYNGVVYLVISIAVTLAISAIIIFASWNLNNLTTKGFNVFASVAAVFAFVGFVLLIIKATSERILFAILAGVFLCCAASLILFCVVCGLRKRFRKTRSMFEKLLDLLNIYVAVISMFAAISICFA
uniref:Inhibitor of apoptosis-promoting Bax1 n=1 Tax=Trichobilharzia regenti TaxID=157069 RepID=A0AA85JCS5_TRIRE|nr:unnamed protein product [Trichobilharzia regenti]